MGKSFLLHELVDIYLGLTHTPEYVFDGIPFLSVKNISSGKIDFSQCNYITEIEYSSLPNGAKPQIGDMLFCRVGTIGKPVIIEPNTPKFGSFVSLGFFRLKDSNLCKLKYLYYWMYSESFYSQVKKNVKGASQVNLNTGWLSKFEVPMYSLVEQENIIWKLEKLDKLIALRKEQLAKLDQLVKSRFIELFEKGGYEKVSVHSVLDTAFWLMPATPEFIADGEVPYITSKNIKNRTIDFNNVKYISREAYKSISANRPTQIGDILISMIGTLGQTAVIQDDREFYGQNLYLLRLNNSIVNTTYFCEFFNSDTAQHELQGKRNQSTQAYLKANHVEGLLLPLPPMELQKQFAAFVEQTDKSKLAIQQSLDKLEMLKKSLMQEYFG